jgi:hypothetical protein
VGFVKERRLGKQRKFGSILLFINMPVKQRARLAQVALVALSEEVKFSPYSRRKLTSTAASNTSTAPQTRKSRKQTSEVAGETLVSDNRYRAALEKLEVSYQKNGDPVKAPQMRKYMKDQFDYYGLQSPGKDSSRMWRSS